MSDHEYWKALCGPLGLDVVGYSRRVDVLVEFPSGYRAGFAPEDLLSTASEHRKQVIRELIEKAENESWTWGLAFAEEPPDQADHAATWLKSQMEGE